jgi:glycosyltransferase involved in cell wall biosynthesis
LEAVHILIVDNLQVSGGPPTQGEALGRLFAAHGAQVCMTARTRYRWWRPIKVLWNLFALGPRYDTVLVNAFSDRSFVNATVAVLGSRLLHKHIIVLYRGGGIADFLAYGCRWVHFVLDRAHQICAPSEFVAGVLRQEGFQVGIVPNFIELDRYPFRERQASNHPRLLWLRRLRPAYNPAMALRALALVQQHLPRATLTIVGPDPGNLRPSLEQLAHRSAVTGISFTGHVAKREIPAICDQHDIFLNTTFVDNQPVSVIEAMACGMVVISTSVGGIPSLLGESGSGLMVPADDHEAMAAAILDVTSSDQKMREIGTQAREFVAKRCSPDVALQNWRRLILM